MFLYQKLKTHVKSGFQFLHLVFIRPVLRKIATDKIHKQKFMFLFKLGMMTDEADGDHSVGRSSYPEWFKKLKKEKIDLEDIHVR